MELFTPDFTHELDLWGDGHKWICGIDEVGKGAWAGPLMVAVAIGGDSEPPAGINDSKAISEKKREDIFDEVAAWCAYWATGSASPQECDELGMSKAQNLATERALSALEVEPDWALVDGKWNFLPECDLRERSTMLIKGDTKSTTISAASILAKVTRDRIMRKIGDTHGPYRFTNNKGYRCQWHESALKAWGATPIHRTSWAFMDAI